MNEVFDRLRELSKDFASYDVPQIIPIDFTRSNPQLIDETLTEYGEFLNNKLTELEEKKVHLNKLITILTQARTYLDQNKDEVNELIQNNDGLEYRLMNKPKIKVQNFDTPVEVIGTKEMFE